MIALYEFLEEQPFPHASGVSSASTSSGTAGTGGLGFGGTLETQGVGTVQGSDLGIGDAVGKQDDHPLDGTTQSTQTGNPLDWATSVGFLRVEADVPAVGDVSGSLLDNRVTTDIVIHAGDLL